CERSLFLPYRQTARRRSRPGSRVEFSPPALANPPPESAGTPVASHGKAGIDLRRAARWQPDSSPEHLAWLAGRQKERHSRKKGEGGRKASGPLAAAFFEIGGGNRECAGSGNGAPGPFRLGAVYVLPTISLQLQNRNRSRHQTGSRGKPDAQ